jgi:hypothetical protein
MRILAETPPPTFLRRRGLINPMPDDYNSSWFSAWMNAMRPSLILASLVLAISAGAAQAAGSDIGRPLIFGDGIACDARLLSWRSVWYGHFSGGTARYAPNSPAALVDWHDDKLCFPSRRECLRWQKAERRHYHQIKGDWACLLLR